MDKPTQCPKSYSPYNYCPLAFMHEDDFILAMLSGAFLDIKRLAGLKQTLSGEEAIMLDSRCKEITAYMNGRIHATIQMLERKEV